MKRLVWLTDIHLNFVSHGEAKRFAEEVRACGPDAVLIGGDTGEAESVTYYLNDLAAWLECPVYFVLGNHDFYNGSIAGTRSRIRALCGRVASLTWLDETQVVGLSASTALIGHGGWADGALGNYSESFLPLNDYHLIEELSGTSRAAPLETMRGLAAEAAEHMGRTLATALETHRRVIALTHVPPFREACWHEGRISDEKWLPHFTCKAVGDVLLEAMRDRPDCHLTVLCGHTHSPGRAEVLENLVVLTGRAEYDRPGIQDVLTIG